MKNIRKFNLFVESLEEDESSDFEAGEDFNKSEELDLFSEISSKIDELSDLLEDDKEYEEGEESSDFETEDHLEHDERELDIIQQMKSHVEELKGLRDELLGEEDEFDDEFDEELESEEEVMDESKKHPGFLSVASKIANKQEISKDRASAILASSTRKSSAAAKKRNPRLPLRSRKSLPSMASRVRWQSLTI